MIPLSAMPALKLRRIPRWFNHLVTIDCPNGCTYCAQDAFKRAKKNETLTRLERLCLDVMFESGGQAYKDAIVKRGVKVRSELQWWWISKRLESLEKRGLVSSRISPRKTNPVSGARELFRLEPAGLRALGRSAPDPPGQDEKGQTLQRLLCSRDSISIKDAACIGIGLCFELGRAHRQGIAHGDIRTQNVWVGPDFKIRLMNFGAADEATKEDDIYQVGTLIREMSLYTSKPSPTLKWVADHAIRPDENYSFSSVEQIQRQIEVLMDPVPDPPPDINLRAAAKLAGWTLALIVAWFLWDTSRVPTWLQDWFFSWFVQN